MADVDYVTPRTSAGGVIGLSYLLARSRCDGRRWHFWSFDCSPWLETVAAAVPGGATEMTCWAGGDKCQLGGGACNNLNSR